MGWDFLFQISSNKPQGKLPSQSPIWFKKTITDCSAVVKKEKKKEYTFICKKMEHSIQRKEYLSTHEDILSTALINVHHLYANYLQPWISVARAGCPATSSTILSGFGVKTSPWRSMSLYMTAGREGWIRYPFLNGVQSHFSVAKNWKTSAKLLVGANWFIQFFSRLGFRELTELYGILTTPMLVFRKNAMVVRNTMFQKFVVWTLNFESHPSDCLWIFFTELGKALSIQCLIHIGVREKPN